MHVFDFKYCPSCKGNLEKHEEYLRCLSCGETIYINPTPGASVYPVKEGKVLLSKRAIEPFKGEWDSIGGFMKPDESVEEAVVREAREETGLKLTNLEYLGTYPSVYGAKNAEPIINIYFTAKVSSGEMSPKDDISELKWFAINELDKVKSSFKNVTDSMRDLQKWYSKQRK